MNLEELMASTPPMQQHALIKGFQAGAASRDAEVAELKTVPMKYRRMAFNAQLQGEVARLEQENDQFRAELEAARAEIERLENQVQARDAELWGRTQKILQLEQQLAAEQAKSVEVRDFIARAQVSSGVCCCGDAMGGHASPMVCGHSPVDMWDYAVGTLLHAPSDTSTPEQSLAAYRNKVIDAFVNEFSRHVGGDGEFWLHELQDFAMKELQ